MSETENIFDLFTHTSTIFSKIEFNRQSQIPAELDLPINIQVKIVDNEKFPKRLQFNIQISSQDKEELKFTIEAIGIFEAEVVPTKVQKIEYLSQRGVYLIWGPVGQLVQYVTSQMGMNPINIRTPKNIDLSTLARDYIGEVGSK